MTISGAMATLGKDWDTTRSGMTERSRNREPTSAMPRGTPSATLRRKPPTDSAQRDAGVPKQEPRVT